MRRAVSSTLSPSPLTPQVFTAKGFVFVSINYRLRPKATIKEMAGAGISAKAYPAEGKNPNTLNDGLGTPDDKPTQVLFDFLSGVLKKCSS